MRKIERHKLLWSAPSWARVCQSASFMYANHLASVNFNLISFNCLNSNDWSPNFIKNTEMLGKVRNTWESCSQFEDICSKYIFSYLALSLPSTITNQHGCEIPSQRILHVQLWAQEASETWPLSEWWGPCCDCPLFPLEITLWRLGLGKDARIFHLVGCGATLNMKKYLALCSLTSHD